MNIITGWQKSEIDFFNHKIKMELLPLSVEQVKTLEPFLLQVAGFKEDEKADKTKQNIEAQMKAFDMQLASKEILLNNVRNIETDITVDGSVLTPEHFALPHLSALIPVLLGNLLMLSVVTEDELKKSKPPLTRNELEDGQQG